MRGLTAGEVAILEKYFKGAIRYAHVRVHRRRYLPWQPSGVAMAPNGHIYFTDSHFLDDFSLADLGRRSWFVHEAVHVWQYQNRVFLDLRILGGLAILRGDYARPGWISGQTGKYLYEFKLGRDQDFLKFGYEQQAAAIENYYAALNGGDGKAPRSPDLELFDDPEAGLLRSFLQHPAYAADRRSTVILAR